MSSARNPLDVRTPYCIDCGNPEITTWWGVGGRCKKDSDRVEAARLAKQKLEMERRNAIIDALPPCEECGEKQGLTGYGEAVCQECCEHDRDADEGFMCTLCDAEWEG